MGYREMGVRTHVNSKGKTLLLEALSSKSVGGTESEPKLTPKGKKTLPEAQMRIEPMMLHHAGQCAQHTTDFANLAPITDWFVQFWYIGQIAPEAIFRSTRTLLDLFLTIQSLWLCEITGTLWCYGVPRTRQCWYWEPLLNSKSNRILVISRSVNISLSPEWMHEFYLICSCCVNTGLQKGSSVLFSWMKWEETNWRKSFASWCFSCPVQLHRWWEERVLHLDLFFTIAHKM